MGVFDKIKDALFGRHAQAAEASPSPTGVNASTGPAPVPASTPAPAPAAPQSAPSGATPQPTTNTSQVGPVPGAPSPAPAARSASQVDVEAILDEAVAANGQKLDWRRSIVDMMKALDLDSSLAERKELAQELGYTGDANDSATMNVWLHKALMKKLAENGGKVPSSLTD